MLIFAGLIAYDTQRLKMTYYELGGDQAMGVATNYGALSLYIELHQPVPVPAGLLRQPPLSAPARPERETPRRATAGAFSWAADLFDHR